MTCMKTGAHIYLVPYREFVYGDAFEIEPVLPRDAKMVWPKLNQANVSELVRNTAYFNLAARSREPINNLTEVHYIVHDWDTWFNNGELTSTLLRLNHSFLHTNNFTRETISLEKLAELYP